MKSKRNFIIACISIALITICNANAYSQNKEAVQKTTSRTFAVSRQCVVSVDNSFGNIILKTWDKDEVEFAVTVSCEHKKESEARSMLERINIDFKQVNSNISANTSIGKTIKNCSIEIEYIIMAPDYITIDFHNKFGDIILPSLGNDVKIGAEFGNIKAANLTGKSTLIKSQYGEVDIDNVTNLEIDCSFSDHCYIESAKHIKVDLSYSDLEIGIAGDIDGKAKFSDILINKLTVSAIFSTFEYGDFKISSVDKDFTTIDIDSKFSDIKLYGFTAEHSFTADLKTSFGDITIDDIVKGKNTISKKDFTELFQNAVGNNPGTRLVRILATYDDIVIKR
ncbi:MAG: hypothetical protein PHR20_00545 [Bacteroidales bacterium]|nr:hypothetical protein [Bacteroidales bacterium]